jgi:hypothetical protein
MSTRAKLLLAMVAAMVAAGYDKNLAAIFVAGGAYLILFQLHALEVKVNRLLDDQGISVPDRDIAKD